jgi:hypothetical protein
MEKDPMDEAKVKTQPGSPLWLARMLLVVNGLLWTGLTIYSLFRIRVWIGDVDHQSALVALGLMFTNALTPLWVARGLGRLSRPLYWLGLALMALNLLLSVAGMVGTLDWLILLLSAITLALLFTQRRRFGVKW